MRGQTEPLRDGTGKGAGQHCQEIAACYGLVEIAETADRQGNTARPTKRGKHVILITGMPSFGGKDDVIHIAVEVDRYVVTFANARARQSGMPDPGHFLPR